MCWLFLCVLNDTFKLLFLFLENGFATHFDFIRWLLQFYFLYLTKRVLFLLGGVYSLVKNIFQFSNLVCRFILIALLLSSSLLVSQGAGRKEAYLPTCHTETHKTRSVWCVFGCDVNMNFLILKHLIQFGPENLKLIPCDRYVFANLFCTCLGGMPERALLHTKVSQRLI